ncbi:MAG TPA: type VI secretion system tube protein Hcp, partial [Nannocystis sp.]
DRSTPLIYRAMVTGEVLPEVELVVFAPADRTGKTPLYTVKLSNATISEIRFVTAKDGPEAHEISLTYQKITWTWVEGGVTAEDDWEAPAAKSQVAPKPMPMPR